MENLKSNLKSIVFAVICFLIAYYTITGNIQRYVYFYDALNEIAFFLLAICLGVFNVLMIDWKKLF